MVEKQWEKVGMCDVGVGPGGVFVWCLWKKEKRMVVVFFSLSFLSKTKAGFSFKNQS